MDGWLTRNTQHTVTQCWDRMRYNHAINKEGPASRVVVALCSLVYLSHWPICLSVCGLNLFVCPGGCPWPRWTRGRRRVCQIRLLRISPGVQGCTAWAYVWWQGGALSSSGNCADWNWVHSMVCRLRRLSSVRKTLTTTSFDAIFVELTYSQHLSNNRRPRVPASNNHIMLQSFSESLRV